MSNQEVIQSLQKRLFNKEDTGEEAQVKTIFAVMREMGYTLEQIKELPITTFKCMITILEKEAEDYNKKIHKGKR